MTTPRGLFVIDVSDPTHPRLAGQLTGDFLRNPRCVAIQFRYAFVTDDDGLKVVDITESRRDRFRCRRGCRSAKQRRASLRRAHLRLRRERSGRPRDHRRRKSGAAATRPDVQRGRRAQRHARSADRQRQRLAVRARRRWQKWIARRSADFARHRARRAGIQPAPESEIDRDLSDARRSDLRFARAGRDRVVDETGGQTVVFGRRGARPFHLSEMLPFLRHVDGVYPDDPDTLHNGPLYRVENVARRDGKLFTASRHELLPMARPSPSPDETSAETSEEENVQR